MKSPLIEALLQPAIYPHPVTEFQVTETHTSWVILTGQYAYKIKKPVDFKFLDYTTLEKRKHFCEEEVRLNQRLAPELYIGVVPIYGSVTQPRFSGSGSDASSRSGSGSDAASGSGTGEIIEYAVKMWQFDPNQQLDQRLERAEVTDEDMDAIAKQLAAFHQSAKLADKNRDFGKPEQIHAPVKQNFEQMLPLVNDPFIVTKLKQIAAWSDTTHQRLTPFFKQRREQEKAIRECHGDFYLANITLFNDKIIFFDCIEFNEPFRYTDTMADVGFLLMDLLDKHHPDLAYRFLSTYIEQSQDTHGLLVLLYYTVYRAMVRMKINLLRMQQEQEGADAWIACQQHIQNLLQLTIKLIQPSQRQILMMHGFSGSGKTYLSNHLLHLGMIRLRSDVLRKQLASLSIEDNSQSAVGLGLYTEEMSERTYHGMMEKARVILTAGFPVIIDATFLLHEHRDCFQQLADELKIPWFIIDCRANRKVLEQRIQNRLQLDKTSEATIDVLAFQENNREPLTEIEKQHTIIYENNDVESVMNQIRNNMFMQATMIE